MKLRPPKSIVTMIALSLFLPVGPFAQADDSPKAPADPWVQNSQNTLKLVDGAKSPPAKIGEMAWLTGYWQGPGMGGHCEEAWGQPIGDRMLGWFSLRKEGGLVLSEAMTLVEHDGSLMLRVKHFDPEFVGWENRDGFMSFPLVKLGEQEAYFQGLTFRRTGSGLNIYLVVGGPEKKTEFEFKMTRTEW